MLKKARAQTVSEYLIVLTLFLGAVVVLSPLVRRGTQALIKAEADMIGNQQGAEQDFTENGSYMTSQYSNTQGSAYSEKREWSGGFGTGAVEATDTFSNSQTNMAFVEDS